MKIGILTYHRPCNFGANLQAFASSRYLMSLNHDVKVIDFVREKDLSYSSIIPKTQFEQHRFFVETYLPLTRMVRTEQELKDLVKEETFDVILIGADAVWSATNNYRIFYGAWAFEDKSISANVRISSLSPAIMGGTLNQCSIEEKSIIKNCLEHFSYITVRDNWTKQVLNKELFCDTEYVKTVNPDPVSMIDSLIDDSIWESRGLVSKQYFLMTLPTTWLQSGHLSSKRKRWFYEFKREANKKGYLLVELPLPDGPSGLPFDMVYNIPYNALQWYLTIKNARAYCGLRFHAIVSSIAAGVPFYSVDTYCQRPSWAFWLDVFNLGKYAVHYDKSSKIYNLLQGTGLEKYRNGGFIEFESAKGVVNRLLSCNIETIRSLSLFNQNVFNKNLVNMLS